METSQFGETVGIIGTNPGAKFHSVDVHSINGKIKGYRLGCGGVVKSDSISLAARSHVVAVGGDACKGCF